MKADVAYLSLVTKDEMDISEGLDNMYGLECYRLFASDMFAGPRFAGIYYINGLLMGIQIQPDGKLPTDFLSGNLSFKF
jgi:hypothetical protein